MIGFGLASLGAVALLVGAVLILRAMRSRNGAQRSHRTLERVFQVAGFGLIAMGLVAKTLAEIGRVVGR